MSSLNKKVSELTAEDRARLRKTLGVPRRPYPMLGSVEAETSDGELIHVRHLGVLEDEENPIVLSSERSYAEIVGLAYRDMPTPGMLDIFYEGLQRRRIESRKRVQFIKGEPGAGKSYMGKMIARMRSKQGAFYVDCGGRNLNDILFETVLDFATDKRFYDELDKRLAAGDLSPVSIAMLKQVLGDAIKAKGDGIYAVDWAVVGEPPVSATDEQKAKWDRAAKLNQVVDTLTKIGAKEGISLANNNSLGMTTQKGALIRAWEEGRELVLDEYNKSKEGSDDQLQTVLQFLTGEIDECTVESKLKDKSDKATQTFSFERKDMRTGFFVTMTGNDSEDGSTTRELNRSVYSRLRPRKLPHATEEDWQHRICQILTGLPISTLYKAGERQWKENPEAFGKMLKQWRVLGLSEAEIANIPQLQMELIENWDKVLVASKKLAKFYYNWAQLTNPNSDMLQTPALGEVALEVDDDYFKEVTIDFRIVIDQIGEALDVKAEIRPVLESGGFEIGDWAKEPVLAETEKEDPSMRFGSRLADIILRKVDETSGDVGKKALHAALMDLASKCGLREYNLKEGVAAKHHKVSELLDVNPFTDTRQSVQARLLQKLVADHLREKFSDIKAEDSEILTLGRATAELEKFKAAEVAKSPRENWFYVINTDKSKLRSQPFVKALSQDSVPGPNDGDYVQDIPASGLVEVDSFLATLALPVIGRHNVEALWTTGLSGSGRTSTAEDSVVDEALAMAEGKSGTGLAVATLMARKGEGDAAEATTLHVVRNATSGRLLVIGGRISARQQRLFRHACISYVDRTDARAVAKIDAALGAILRGKPENQAKTLRDAFLLRNRALAPEAKEYSLARLLSGEGVEAALPHYLKAPSATPPVPPAPGGNSAMLMKHFGWAARKPKVLVK
jgi:hypothetical protein